MDNILTQEDFDLLLDFDTDGTNPTILKANYARVLERIRVLTEGYASFDKIMKELSARWGNDEDSKVGKILNALSGHLTNYRTDITELRALVPITPAPEGSGA